ncbi:hypothetical protein FHK17_04205 [Salmonella enterica]|nr:hypothetical protein [Salmonella enterica]
MCKSTGARCPFSPPPIQHNGVPHYAHQWSDKIQRHHTDTRSPYYDARLSLLPAGIGQFFRMSFNAM